MSYVRYNQNNQIVNPQPVSNTVTLYSGSEGFPTLSYKIWNGNYIARNFDNTVRTPSNYQRYNTNNTLVIPSSYQRHDYNNQPIQS